MTTREQAQQQLRQLNRELEDRVAERTAALEIRNAELRAANAELESFSYSISHDLRSPLLSINGFTRLVQEEYASTLDPEAHRLLGRVLATSERMSQLIDDILALSRVVRQDRKSQPVDMAQLVDDTVAELRELEPDRQVTVVLDQLDAALGDQGLLRQVWVNLLTNAFKFTRTVLDPRIHIDNYVDGDEQVYRVRDNGVGFDMAYADKLFDTFQRLHPDTPGTGIGLAISKRIVTRHGGRIWAEGRPTEGACYFFGLPRAGAPAVPRDVAQAAAS